MNIEEARKYCIDCFFGPRIYKALAGTETVRNDVNGVGVTSQQQIAILLRRHNPYAQSVVQTLAQSVQPVPITTIVAGEFQSIRPLLTLNVSRTRPMRSAPGGVSIGHYLITAGTLGCLVRDKEGRTHILSNNHVLANSNNARPLDPVYQPGPYDGGTARHEIAKVSRWRSLNVNTVNYMDAALATPSNPQDVIPDILHIGRVKGTANPALGMPVKKSGRTTGLTRDMITILRAYVQVTYSTLGTLTFDDQIVIQPGGFSRGGDSGSLVVDEANRAIGLLFAGSEVFTLANPIHRVIQELNISSVL